MANAPSDSAPGRPEIPVPIVRQLREIKRVHVAIVLICLVIAACVIAYFLHENARLRGQIMKQQEQLGAMAQSRVLLQQLALDLRGLGATDKNCQALLQKYQNDFAAFGVDVVTGATMGPPAKY